MRPTSVFVGHLPGPRFTFTLSWLRPAHLTVCAYAVIATVVAFTGCTHLNPPYDDAYITFRYAYNLAIGRGYVYNVGEHFLGTSAPLFGILLGLFGAPSPSSIPILAVLLSILSLLALSLGVLRLGIQVSEPVIGFCAALLVASHPLFPATFGGEMLTEAALVLWAVVLYQRKRTNIVAVLLALAVLIRPDAFIASSIVFVHWAYTGRKLPVGPLALFAAMLLPFALASWVFYGSPLPGTLDAKTAQTTEGWATFLDPLVNSSSAMPCLISPSQSLVSQTALCLTISSLIGLYCLSRYRGLHLLLLCLIAHCIVMQVIGLPFYHWYYVPLDLALCLLAGSGVASLIKTASPVPCLAGVALVLSLPAAQLPPYLVQRTNPEYVDYKCLGTWLDGETAPGASVGYCEIGILGFYSHRRIIDALGLVNRGGSELVRQHRIAQVFRITRPDYIIDVPEFGSLYMTRVKGSAWFRREYRKRTVLPSVRGQPMTIYQRVLYSATDGSRPLNSPHQMARPIAHDRR